MRKAILAMLLTSLLYAYDQPSTPEENKATKNSLQ
jgi:hypothetical protein